MKATISVMVIVAGLMAMSNAGAAEKANKLSAEVAAVLSGAEKFELLSLDPRDGDPKAGFHSYPVLFQTTIDNGKTQGAIVAALEKGIAASNGDVALCFNPRHGIRATLKKKTVDLVICFECLQIQVFVDGKPQEGVLTANSPTTTFDKILKEAKEAAEKKAADGK